MNIDLSTFILEIINFLVLVWILKRFLYQPVISVIARRKAGIDGALAEAERREKSAAELEASFRGRLDRWAEERERERGELAGQLAAERERRLQALRAELAQERDKAAAELRAAADETRLRAEQAAAITGARFASRLLQAVAGEDTGARLVDLALQELPQLPAARARDLADALARPDAKLVVTTAHRLGDARRRAVQQALRALAGASELQAEFVEDPALVAGVRIVAGPWVLGLSVADELRAFGELRRAA